MFIPTMLLLLLLLSRYTNASPQCRHLATILPGMPDNCCGWNGKVICKNDVITELYVK
jgi:hypothetical protein